MSCIYPTSWSNESSQHTSEYVLWLESAAFGNGAPGHLLRCRRVVPWWLKHQHHTQHCPSHLAIPHIVHPNARRTSGPTPRGCLLPCFLSLNGIHSTIPTAIIVPDRSRGQIRASRRRRLQALPAPKGIPTKQHALIGRHFFRLVWFQWVVVVVSPTAYQGRIGGETGAENHDRYLDTRPNQDLRRRPREVL